MNERDIFIAARPIHDPAERATFLDEACAGDDDLRRRVVALLDEQAKLGSFLEHADDPGAETRELPIVERPGAVIGAYKLLEQIGEGGFGVVFLAEQTQPVRRKVALKVLKPGMDTRQVVARFEAERQALAIMDHPNIAKVFDGGATPSGRPYFVMELVKGTPITVYCDDNHLTPRERLNLFLTVCQAVQHAHQKGIIHRDLKPSNVLVSRHDSTPIVKVIDFGVAKALGQDLTEKTLFTGIAQMIGTPLYMSPEQAGMSDLDVDTRSDIYSLGVLLYELLTGTTPFDRERFKTAAYDEIRRIIREEEPPRPSTRLSQLGRSRLPQRTSAAASGRQAEATERTSHLASVSALRQTEPARLTRLVQGELDWIVMKALEKDRNRRYETANGLAMDVQRYLADEPVQACPPSAAYRVRKFVRRNKGPALAAAVVLLSLVGGIVGTTWGLLRATEAEAIATARAKAEKQARDEADDAKKEAVANLQKAREAVDQMLTRVAEEKLLNVPHLYPVRKAILEDALKFYRSLLQQKSADPALRLGTGTAWRRVGAINANLDHHADAEKAMQQSVTFLEKLVLELPSAPEYRLELAESHAKLGELLLYRLGRPREAAEEYRRALELQTQSPSQDHVSDLGRILLNEHHLASALARMGEYGLAEEGFRRGLAVIAEHEHLFHFDYHRGIALRELAGILIETNRDAEAEKVLRQALVVLEKLVAQAPNVEWHRFDQEWALQHLVTLLRRTGRPREAEEACGRAIAINRRLVTDYPEVLHHRAALARCLVQMGNLKEVNNTKQEAESLYQEAWAASTDNVREGIQPDRTWFSATALSQDSLAQFLMAAGRMEDAEAYYRRALSFWDKLTAQSPDVFGYRYELARTHSQLGAFWASIRRTKEAENAFQKAITLADETLKLQKAKLGSEHPDLIHGMGNLADAYDRIADFPRAEAVLRELLPIRRKTRGADHRQVTHSLALLGHNLLKQKKYAEAEPLLRECLAIREKKLPDDWLRFNAESLLGDALLGQKKYADAEPLLLAGYEGMKQREAKIPAQGKIRLTEALERLVQLYEARGDKDQADAWRKKLPVTKSAKPAQTKKD
jgi:eukaryotic-like serine/threonine-protein kinase